MSTFQLDFFEKTKEDLILADMRKMHNDIATLRRSFFSKHSELCKLYSETLKEIQDLKKDFQKLKGEEV